MSLGSNQQQRQGRLIAMSNLDISFPYIDWTAASAGRTSAGEGGEIVCYQCGWESSGELLYINVLVRMNRW